MGRVVDTVVCWKWKKPGYRHEFTADHVHALAHSVRDKYRSDVRVLCVTDDPSGIQHGVDTLPLSKVCETPNPSFTNGPSCYHRLQAFSKEFEEHVGKRFVSLDLDVALTGDLTPLFEADHDFLAWKGPRSDRHVNGSIWVMDTGSQHEVWDRFDPEESPGLTHAAGCRGSDQGWIQYCVNNGWAEVEYLDKDDGIYSFRLEVAIDRKGELPENARVVIFHGPNNPWDPHIQVSYPWVKLAYLSRPR